MAIAYTYPGELKDKDLHLLADPQGLDQSLRSHNLLDQRNQELYQDALKAHSKLVEDARALYGDRAKEVAYLRQRPPEKPLNMTKRWQKLMRRFSKWQAEERKRKSSRKSYQCRKAREDEAMEFLTSAGYVRNKDFDRYDCLRVAERLRGQLAIAAAVIGGHLVPGHELQAVSA